MMETVYEMASPISLILVIILLRAHMKHGCSDVVGQCVFKYVNIATKMSQCLQFLKINGILRHVNVILHPKLNKTSWA